jgi:uncharacterized protein (TIGR02145 family)
MKKFFGITGAILIIIMVVSCEEKSKLPALTTTDVTEISYTTAISGGVLTDDGGSPIISTGVCWSTTANPTISNNKSTESGESGSFSSNITLLTPNTLYYIRAYATNSDGTGYGNQLTFTTLPASLPALTTSSISMFTKTTAVSGGNITADNGGPVTARGVCWGIAPDPTISLSTKTFDGTGTGTFTSTITGLTSGTTYYVRAYSTNSAGTNYGTQVSFTTATSATLPALTSGGATNITESSVKVSVNIISDGDLAVTARGVCWSTSQNPTTSGNKTTDGTGTGVFVSSITNLTWGTTYYFKAYATNSLGTVYGNETRFTTNGIVSDISGNIYRTITIGTQVWMAENLTTVRYRNGDSIRLVNDPIEWGTLVTGAYSNYNNNQTNSGEYGRLYNWYAVNDSRNLAPAGWHVATDADWTVLTTYLGGTNVAGGKLKESGSAHWISLNEASNNETGFTALPGGYRYYTGTYELIDDFGFWWSATEASASNGWYRYILSAGSAVYRHNLTKKMGASVRCVKD